METDQMLEQPLQPVTDPQPEEPAPEPVLPETDPQPEEPPAQEKNLEKQIRWLYWAVGIMGVLCITVMALLLAVLLRPAPAPVAEAVEQTTLPPQTTTEPVETEPPEPTLNLPPSPYAAENFAWVDGYMTYTAGPCRVGIDVSSWQNDIDWQQVKDAGIEFALIRMAWRGNTEGGIREDKNARINYAGAREAGIPVGAYFFSQATTPEEAVEEARFLLDMIRDWEIEMPIVFDWERSENRTYHTDAQTVTDCAKAFCQTIEDAGYDSMVYFNIRQAYNEMYLEELQEYGFWLAQYNEEMTFPYKVDMWQYTSKGSVPGIDTNVDINILFTEE